MIRVDVTVMTMEERLMIVRLFAFILAVYYQAWRPEA
jgi:hypothetical protein